MNGSTRENPVVSKSFDFAVRIVKLYKHLVESHKEYTLSKQILRSGTSVGANIEEAQGGYSKKEFRSKLSISYKELRETKYWLRLLHKTEYMEKAMFNSLFKDADELGKLLFTIIKNTDPKK